MFPLEGMIGSFRAPAFPPADIRHMVFDGLHEASSGIRDAVFRLRAYAAR